MKYPDYHFVDVAVAGAMNRNKLTDVTRLGDPSGKILVDTYMTYFRYNREMVEHYKSSENKKANSVMGFKRSAYADFIPVDIDTENLDMAIHQTVRLLEIIQNYDIDLNVCKIYFSGSKGFHVLIPSELVNVEPSEDIHIRFRRFIKRLAVGVQYDSSIYDIVRIFRLPNTINSKSGKYKIRLYPFEIYNSESKDILELASQPREEWEAEEADYSGELGVLYHQEDGERQSSTEGTTIGVKVKLCMQKMMMGVKEGERDNAALRVVTHLKYSGLSLSMIWNAFSDWNESNRPPLTDKEMDRIYQQGLKNYDFGCNDFLLSAYCDKSCLFYKER